MICLPTDVEPVNEILSIWGWVEMRLPTASPPGITDNTPGGNEVCEDIKCARYSVDKGVCGAGLIITAFPHAKAGASFHDDNTNG